MTTLPGEIGCDECIEQMDHFIDTTLAGGNAAQRMPSVWHHLERCSDCQEEFKALLVASRALPHGTATWSMASP